MDDASRFDGKSVRRPTAQSRRNGPGLRHRHHGQGLGAGTHQDPVGAAADLRRSRGAQHRVSCRTSPTIVLLGRALTAAIAGYAAFGPPGSEDFFRGTLPAGDRPDRRLAAEFRRLPVAHDREIFARGHGSAVVLNSDSPTLPTALLVETADVLARPGDRAVLGPSSDGGYYLLGLKTAHRRMFEDIAWSTERVAAQTLRTRARDRVSTSTCCRSGTTSTTSTVCVGSTAKCAGRAEANVNSIRGNRTFRLPPLHCSSAFGPTVSFDRRYVKSPHSRSMIFLRTGEDLSCGTFRASQHFSAAIRSRIITGPVRYWSG